MRKVLTLCVCISSFLIAIAQKDSSKIKEKAYKEFREKNSNYAHIYLYVTKGGKEQKLYEYFFCDSAFKFIFRNKTENRFTDKISKRDDLFTYIDSNFEALKSLIPYIKYPALEEDYLNKKKVFTQIGIRYKDLFCNHYLLKTDDEIDLIKNEDARNGQRIINAIAKYFEDKFK